MRKGMLGKTRGVTSVELTLGLPVLLMLLFGIIEFGRYTLLRSSLQTALDVAARQYRVETVKTVNSDGTVIYVPPSDARLTELVRRLYAGDGSQINLVTTEGFYDIAYAYNPIVFDGDPFGYLYKELRAALPHRLAIPFLGSAGALTINAVARIPAFNQHAE